MQHSKFLSRVASLLFLAASLTLSSCTDDPVAVDKSESAAVNGMGPTIPERPVFESPGSNWTPSFGKIASIGTTDMNSQTASSLAATLVFGPGIGISNATFTGASVGGGLFSGGNGILGDAAGGPYIDTGVILSTGNVASVAGPNTSDNVTTLSGTSGDADLDALAGVATHDAAILEFDFDCGSGGLGGDLAFKYVFSSDEYNEYVGTGFNDVFGFYLNGVNIAVLPGSAPVTINTVNGGNPYGVGATNSALFNNNDPNDPGPPSIDTEMDGLTDVLVATGPLVPGTNHMKLAIADGTDNAVDSNVFIQGGSFQCSIVVSIDVKPGSDRNPINRGGKGKVPVALLGSSTFDVMNVDLGSVSLNGAPLSTAKQASHYEDVDADGNVDLLMHFPTRDLGLADGQSEVCLSGQTLGGVAFEGCDSIYVVK